MKKLLLLLLCVPLMFSCGDNSDKEENEDNVKQKRYDIYNEVFLSNDSAYLVDRDENKLSGEIYLTNLHNNKEIYFGNVQNGVPYGKWRIYDDNGKNCIFKGEFKDNWLSGKYSDRRNSNINADTIPRDHWIISTAATYVISAYNKQY